MCCLHIGFTGVKATYLLAVAFLEIIRFSSNGGILNGVASLSASRSSFSCVFEYLKTPNLIPAVFQCLTAIVHRAFEAAVFWLVFFNSFHLKPFSGNALPFVFLLMQGKLILPYSAYFLHGRCKFCNNASVYLLCKVPIIIPIILPPRTSLQ